KAPMLKAGGCGATSVIAGKLYVYTACQANAAAFQRYDPATNSWTLLPAPASPRGFPAGGGINGKLYLAGGMEDNGISLTVLQMYDPVTNAWTERRPMPTPRGRAMPAVIDGLLYVVGGSRSGTAVGAAEVYDPGTDSWQARPSMPTPRVGL